MSGKQNSREISVTEKLYDDPSARITISDFGHVLKSELEKAGYTVVGVGGDYVIRHEVPAIRYNNCTGAGNFVPTRFKLNEWSNIRVEWTVVAKKSGRNIYVRTFDGDFSYKKTWHFGASETPGPAPLKAIENAFGQSVRRMLADESFPGSEAS